MTEISLKTIFKNHIIGEKMYENIKQTLHFSDEEICEIQIFLEQHHAISLKFKHALCVKVDVDSGDMLNQIIGEFTYLNEDLKTLIVNQPYHWIKYLIIKSNDRRVKCFVMEGDADE